MKTQLMVVAVASSMALAGCTQDPATGQAVMDKRLAGALIGAGSAYAVSKASKGTHVKRDVIAGALVGAGVGQYMESQAKKIQQQVKGTGVKVALDPKTNDIKVTIPNNITFDVDKANIKPQFTGTLSKLAQTMSQYDKTEVVVIGHTDSDGSEAHNNALSKKRAISVATYLYKNGVQAERIKTDYYGESRPIASNATEAGKAKNRRVEIKINAPKSL